MQVTRIDSQTIDSDLVLHSEGELQSTLTKQQLRHRQPFTADDDIPDDGEKDIGKKPHGVHYRKISNTSDDSNGSHGFLPGLMKKIGFGSQEFKEKDIHALEAHPSHSGSHGFLSGLMKKASSGSQEFKNVGYGEHHHHKHHSHGTRDKEIFGSEDADGNHDTLFGLRDMENQRNLENANSLFGFEDTEFERGEKGRDLFGSDDPDTLSFRDKMKIVGPVDADAERIRHVFGDENTEDSDDDLKREKKVHKGCQ